MLIFTPSLPHCHQTTLTLTTKSTKSMDPFWFDFGGLCFDPFLITSPSSHHWPHSQHFVLFPIITHVDLSKSKESSIWFISFFVYWAFIFTVSISFLIFMYFFVFFNIIFFIFFILFYFWHYFFYFFCIVFICFYLFLFVFICFYFFSKPQIVSY